MTEMNINKPLFPNLEGETAKKGLNRKTLGQAVGLSPNQMSNRWNGEVEFTLDEVIKIAEVLENSVEYLFQRSK